MFDATLLARIQFGANITFHILFPSISIALAWAPFAGAVTIFALAFYGLAYSLFPYLVIDRMTMWQAASAPEALEVILIGAAIVLPAIFGYTVYSYRVFRGKARDLSYD